MTKCQGSGHFTSLLKKYEKLRYTGVNYFFSKRPKLYNTKCLFSEGVNASNHFI